MWKCTNCHHAEFGTDKPHQCPVCGAEAGKLIPHELSGVKGTKTLSNLKAGFVAESQAHLRSLAFAMKAEEEGYSSVEECASTILERGIHFTDAEDNDEDVLKRMKGLGYIS